LPTPALISAIVTTATVSGDPLKAGTLLVSQFVSPGSTDAVAYDPYSMLRSTEDLFGLSPLANAGGKKVHSFGASLRGGESVAGD
jgi:hypothetical protein